MLFRSEVVVPVARVAEVVAAMKAAHSYQEPAFDLVQLAAPPEGVGQGRIGTMAAAERGEVFERIKRELGVKQMLVAGPVSGKITSAAVCAGACGDMLDDALAARAELYLTGEMRHHDALKAAAAGMTVVCVLHSNSERAVLRRLWARMREKLEGVEVLVSEVDRDPFVIR